MTCLAQLSGRTDATLVSVIPPSGFLSSVPTKPQRRCDIQCARRDSYYDKQIVTSRRTFLASAMAAPIVLAQPPNWGGSVLDIHLHPKRDEGGEIKHMDGCGVAKAVILGGAAQHDRIKSRMEKALGRMTFFASVDVTRPDAIQMLR